MLALFKLCKFIFRHVIPRPFRYGLASSLGRFIVFLNRPRREILLGNLIPLVGGDRARAIAPIQLGNFAMTAVDFFCTRPGLARTTVTENWHLLEQAYRKTRRVMAVTAHMGHWELGISVLVEKRHAVTGVYAPYREDAVVQWILSHRDPDVEWIPAVHGAAEACIDAIRRGRVLGMVADIPFAEKGRRVTIAGHEARLPLGPWAIAVRAKATVMPAFILRQSPGQYRLVMHDAIVPPDGLSFRRQMERMQDVYVTHLERYLKTYPEQWGVLQPFWDAR